jgi:hypothetical protein
MGWIPDREHKLWDREWHRAAFDERGSGVNCRVLGAERGPSLLDGNVRH